MQGRKIFEEEKELFISLPAQVPEHNFYRRLKQLLDPDFLYALTLASYGQCGQQSIRLAVLFNQYRKLEEHRENLPASPGALGTHHLKKVRLVSNKTHYNPTDPPVRISVKPNKARKLKYPCSLAVDALEGKIGHVQADSADSRDSQYLLAITWWLQRSGIPKAVPAAHGNGL
jgi:hypothetical protein